MAILKNLRPERSELIRRFLAILKNFRPERERAYASNFGYFHEFETRKDWTYSSIFKLFSRIVDQKGMSILLGDWRFSQIWKGKEWTYCSTMAFLRFWYHKGMVLLLEFLQFFFFSENLRPDRNDLVIRFSAIFEYFKTRKEWICGFILFCSYVRNF